MKDSLDTGTVANASGQSIASLLKAAHALEERVEEALGSVGLSAPKFSVLSALVAAPEPIALGELASKLSCVKSNATQMVDRLEADGLVRRVSDPDDRRSIRAEVTPLGRERQLAGAEVMAKLEARFEEAVGAEDRSAMLRMLRSIDATD